MWETHIVEIDRSGRPEPYNLEIVSKSKKHSVLFTPKKEAGPESFTVKFRERTPFDSDEFTQRSPWTGPARENAQLGPYHYEVTVPRGKSGNQPPSIIIIP